MIRLLDLPLWQQAVLVLVIPAMIIQQVRDGFVRRCGLLYTRLTRPAAKTA